MRQERKEEGQEQMGEAMDFSVCLQHFTSAQFKVGQRNTRMEGWKDRTAENGGVGQRQTE